MNGNRNNTTEKGKKMINAKGEVIYTNAEIASGRIDTLELLADALGISIDEYVGHKVMVKNHA